MGLVLFIDMDSFYASCEELRHPELKGKAFVVGTSDEQNKLRGVVETASYTAKRAGIHSGMPTVMALKTKKDVVYIQSDHDYYDKVSAKIMDKLRAHGYKMEMVSIDEAALDLGETGYDAAMRIGEKIKAEINNSLGLPCTIGISSGKVFAKMVCDDAKPDGLKMVRKEEIVKFLKDKKVESILGVGRKTAERLNSVGIMTVGDLARADVGRLAETVGSFGRELHMLANGRDESEVMNQWKILSIGRERTLDKRTSELGIVNEMLDELSEEVITEVSRNGFAFKTVTVKALYADFTDRVKGRSMGSYSDSLELLKKMSHELICELAGPKPFRKVGVRVSSLVPNRGQKKLF